MHIKVSINEPTNSLVIEFNHLPQLELTLDGFIGYQAWIGGMEGKHTHFIQYYHIDSLIPIISEYQDLKIWTTILKQLKALREIPR